MKKLKTQNLYEYMKEWRKNNKDKIKKHNNNYYLKNKDNILERAKYDRKFIIEL